MCNTTIHPFEQAGLGKAPFKCIAAYELRGPLRYPQADGTVIEVGSPGQPMGTCDYCGMGIANCYKIRSSDGHLFVVGSECVAKTAPKGEDTEGFKEAKRELNRVKRERRSEAAKAARAAKQEAKRAERLAQFKAEHGDLYAMLCAKSDAGTLQGFEMSMLKAIEEWGSLTDGQLAALRQDIARRQEREQDAANSEFFGEVKQRVRGEFEVLVVRVSDGLYGLSFWHLMRHNGNVCTYRGSRKIGGRGDVIDATFTVKAHDEYKGTKQTQLQRPIVHNMIKEAEEV
jgi:hypothetical protein